MRISTVFHSFVLAALLHGGVAAQETAADPIPPDALMAVVGWYQQNAIEAGGTLVLSPLTMNVAPGERDRSVRRVVPRSLRLSDARLRQISDRLGMDVRVCGEYAEVSATAGPCGAAYPWTWIEISELRRASSGTGRLVVEERRLLIGPSGQVDVESFRRYLRLEATGRGWNVVPL